MPDGLWPTDPVDIVEDTEPIIFHPVTTGVVRDEIGVPSISTAWAPENFSQYPLPFSTVSFVT